jgi:hypothetical protein
VFVTLTGRHFDADPIVEAAIPSSDASPVEAVADVPA